MRAVINSVIVLMLIALISAVGLHLRAKRHHDLIISQTRDAVVRLQREVRLRAAMEQTKINGRGWPVSIDPKWFQSKPPMNALLGVDRPWLEIASTDEAELVDPPVRLAISSKVAAFWYNPGNGVVRARSPVAVSDRQSTSLYNRINQTHLVSIFQAPARSSPDMRSAQRRTSDQRRTDAGLAD